MADTDFNLDEYIQSNKIQDNTSDEVPKQQDDFDLGSYITSNSDQQTISKELPKQSEPVIEEPEEEGIISKIGSAVQHPLDFIPSMKEKRLEIEAYRQTPEYIASHPNPITGMEDPVYNALGLAGPESGITIIKNLAKLGTKGLKYLTSPKTLEKTGSRLAESTVGMKPVSEIPVRYDTETGRLLKQFGEVKGTGKAAIEEGVLPLTGGMEKIAANAQDAITKKFQQLEPVLSSAQKKINQNVTKAVGEARPLDYKISNYLQDFFDKLPKTSKTPQLKKLIMETYESRIDDIIKGEGNLKALMDSKKELYQDSVSLSKNIYKTPDAYSTENEASFLKGLAQVVKKHTEDLAGIVDSNAGQQVKDINGTISKLINYQESALKSMNKASTGSLSDLLGQSTKLITGFKPSELAKISGAKAAIGAAKAIKTPTGELVQKAIPSMGQTKQAVTTGLGAYKLSPFSPSSDESEDDHYETRKSDATILSSNLYNATNDSLDNLAKNLSTNENPTISGYGKHLNKALKSNDNGEKNRAIFLILQNPQSRKLITPQGEK